MNEIKLLTKLYELIELIGRERVYALLERAIKEVEKTIAEDDIWLDAQEQKRSEYEREEE